jgi:lysine/ornithine N-monooxygenase
MLHLHELGLYPDLDMAREVVMATGPEPTVPELYRAYTQVFSMADSEPMSCHSLQDLAIELLNGKQLP